MPCLKQKSMAYLNKHTGYCPPAATTAASTDTKMQQAASVRMHVRWLSLRQEIARTVSRVSVASWLSTCELGRDFPTGQNSRGKGSQVWHLCIQQPGRRLPLAWTILRQQPTQLPPFLGHGFTGTCWSHSQLLFYSLQWCPNLGLCQCLVWSLRKPHTSDSEAAPTFTP